MSNSFAKDYLRVTWRSYTSPFGIVMTITGLVMLGVSTALIRYSGQTVDEAFDATK